MAKKNNLQNDLNRCKPKYPKQIIKFSVPITPSINHMYIAKTKTLTKTAQKYVQVAQNICREAMKAYKWKKDEPHVWYYMDLFFYFPDLRIRDSHNCIKLLMDVLEGLLFPNDYFVMPRVQNVVLDRENPHIEIVFSAQEW